MKGMDTHLQELVAKAEGKWRNVIGKLEPLQEKLREFLATPLVDEAGPSASADELEAASFGFDDEILEEAEGEDEDEDEDEGEGEGEGEGEAEGEAEGGGGGGWGMSTAAGMTCMHNAGLAWTAPPERCCEAAGGGWTPPLEML